MADRYRIRFSCGLALIAASLLMLAVSLYTGPGPYDTSAAAARLERRLSGRLAILDGYMEAALTPPSDSSSLDGPVPDDIVLYRYRSDTLQAWQNQFPLRSDDITPRTAFPMLGHSGNTPLSPLALVTEKPSYVNYGPKWYVVKALRDGPTLVIGGVEVIDEMDASLPDGINRRLSPGGRFTIHPISSGQGTPVSVDGVTLFLLCSEKLSSAGPGHPVLSWVAVILFVCGVFLFLSGGRTLVQWAVSMGLLTLMALLVYLRGMKLQDAPTLFSPNLYAYTQVLYSLGAVIVVNTWITLLVLCTYMARWALLKSVSTGRRKLKGGIALAAVVVAAAGIMAYLHFTFKSIVLHSGIGLELYKFDNLSIYTGVVYLSFLGLSMTLPLLVQIASPLVRRSTGLRYNAFSRVGRSVFALLVAVYFVTVSSLLGFRKEESKVDVWSNRLSMDRDIALEIQLMGVEPYISADPVISSISVLDNSNQLIKDRLIDTYMSRIAQDNDISVYLLGGDRVNPVLESMFNTRIRNASRLGENSRFHYSRDNSGRARYTAFFTYYSDSYGTSGVMVCVESKSNREDRGYLSLLGISEPGKISIPPQYSYAKYLSGKLVLFKGDYAYPTVLREPLPGYRHFVHRVSDDEVVVISRRKTDFTSYLVEGLFLWFIAFLLISAVTFRFRRTGHVERTYFRNRINAVVLSALTVTLVAMAVVSVYFVDKRYEADMAAIMSSKINSIQSMLQSRCRSASSYRDLMTQEINGAVENTGNILKSDITLYTPSGRAFMTTTPEVFDRMILGLRLDEDAYEGIVKDHNRYFIHKEKIGAHSFHSMYAPVFNGEGNMLAIASSPYAEQNYDLEEEAFLHVATIVTLFFLLLLLARFLTSAVIGRMFRPLNDMSRKMKATDLDHLEYIIYDRDDELSSLVRSYNLMVHDLGYSTRELAQAERDKAWSGMARQVAHEIKNPLTPIKLQLQMLIRMKESGNPAWESRFDEVAGVVLEHIDILADTANEFSTFAKLYSEEPVTFDLDALLRGEVEMFDGRDDISFSYIGLEGVCVTGPKPQLTRTFVNLVTNAVQAVEEARKQDAEQGRKPRRGQVTVSLRNSVKDGYYDIVFEDNGLGVKEENKPFLFTPNFTTKSHGTGLGLAICRNIVEKCKGEISYSKSFNLGGACFTIRYPSKG